MVKKIFFSFLLIVSVACFSSADEIPYGKRLYPEISEITVLSPISFLYKDTVYVIYGIRPPRKDRVKYEKKQLEEILGRGQIEIREKYVMPGGIIWAEVRVDGESAAFIIEQMRIPRPTPRIEEQ